MKKRPTPRPIHVPKFEPVPLRARHDGWTPERQIAFIDALAQTACIEDACREVGMGVSSAYTLRQRCDAAPFRNAWDAALQFGVKRLSDVAFSRAIYGVENPVFFQGEQIGTRRQFDERLTMFILRYRDPVRYGKWRDQFGFEEEPDGQSERLTALSRKLLHWAKGSEERIARLLAHLGSEPPEVEKVEGDVSPTSSTSAHNDDEPELPMGPPSPATDPAAIGPRNA